MVLHNIAQRPGFFVEWSAALDTQSLGRRNLHMIDVVPVPHRLEDAVRKAKDQDVLHRLLAQVVVDAEDLILMKDGVYLAVQFARRVQVVAERLLDHHRDLPLLKLGHALCAQVFDNPRKELRRRGQVVQPLAANALIPGNAA